MTPKGSYYGIEDEDLTSWIWVYWGPAGSPYVVPDMTPKRVIIWSLYGDIWVLWVYNGYRTVLR